MEPAAHYEPRRADVRDVPAIRALISRAIAESYADHYVPAAIAFFQEFHSNAAIEARQKRGTVLLIEERELPIATGTLDGSEIVGLFVAPERRGQGLGSILMAALFTEARARGLRRIELSVSRPSYAFYERLGFEIGASRETVLACGGTVPYWTAGKDVTGH
ncbi:GNAT family N-acetyltransferase [Roseibacterium sp. SDUM158017]|uniref:GNAT family N-acetyltransferase n=1 Tax=Roseicyclus salinarum TaxID=3036773 RepID=UPI0024152CC6|nr:GNAT family N-acetyltransferase [Roseibacterium sp. SDUM158017]MDG4650217.1 GNAT family N-acetyltransferase [Roseibacterium sp. SDUM158017]